MPDNQQSVRERAVLALLETVGTHWLQTPERETDAEREARVRMNHAGVIEEAGEFRLSETRGDFDQRVYAAYSGQPDSERLARHLLYLFGERVLKRGYRFEFVKLLAMRLTASGEQFVSDLQNRRMTPDEFKSYAGTMKGYFAFAYVLPVPTVRLLASEPFASSYGSGRRLPAVTPGAESTDLDLLRKISSNTERAAVAAERALLANGASVGTPNSAAAATDSDTVRPESELPDQVTTAAAFIRENPGASGKQVAKAAGYTEDSSFRRAFATYLKPLGFYNENGYRPPRGGGV